MSESICFILGNYEVKIMWKKLRVIDMRQKSNHHT